MKRFIAVLSGLLVLPAFAEVAPVYYDDVIEYSDDVIDDEEIVDETVQNQNQQKNNTQRKTINRSTSASRAISSATNSASTRTNTSTRAIAASPRTTSGTARSVASRTAKTSRVVSRTPATRTSVTSRNTKATKPVTARVGTANFGKQYSVMGTIDKNKSGSSAAYLTDSGDSLYKSRVASAGNRRATSRSSISMGLSTPSTPVITEEDVTSTTSNLTALSELTDYCKAQYAACMDNYCNVLDDNQGRCSCSKNIKNYAKVESALESATEEFQAVVQKIKYIGLTKSQVEALFTETIAEETIRSTSGKDNSSLRSSLDAIKKKILDPTTTTSSTAGLSTGLSFDLSGLLNADFTEGFDLTSFFGNASSTSNVSNQRGEQLYKTATQRCKTAVLNSCTAQGIDANVITNSYDLEIDKQCMAYERSLTEANKEMRNNVINAGNILQQARLLLAQNKNSYDLRGCVAAIDSCMQDEYICGSDYELCLDPTGKYLANGEIVKGGTPGVAGGQAKTLPVSLTNNATNYQNYTSGGMYNLYSTWDYDTEKNAWSVGPTENLGGYIDAALTKWNTDYNKTTITTDNMALYLLQKIGYIDAEDKVHGMCASVMLQCRDYTYEKDKYKAANEVVRQYLGATLAKIKVKQDEILTEYAEGCRADVQSCLSTNGYDESNTSSTASKTAVNSCAAEITTCMSVGGYQVSDGIQLTLRAMTDWVASILMTCPVNYYLRDNGVGSATGTGSSSTTCVACPRFTGSNNEVIITESAGGQVTRCSCPDGFHDVTNENGKLIGCALASCSENYYLTEDTGSNTYSCTECPRYGTNSNFQSTSAGGTVTRCECTSGYEWNGSTCTVSTTQEVSTNVPRP